MFTSDRIVHGEMTDQHDTPNLHLDTEGRAFVYIWRESCGKDEPGSYREVDPRLILREALRHRHA